MELRTYRDMHLLQEVTRTPDVTQRELSQRIGVALGLTNLMLRRLVSKGYIKIKGTKRSRIRYLITPKGILEKSRLTYEFVQASLQLYSRVRQFWREQLATLAQAGDRRILLYGTGELTEIVYLTIREMGLELVGVVEEPPTRAWFLGYAVVRMQSVPMTAYDHVLVVSHAGTEQIVQQLESGGVPPERIIAFPRPGRPKSSRDRREPSAIHHELIPLLMSPSAASADT